MGGGAAVGVPSPGWRVLGGSSNQQTDPAAPRCPPPPAAARPRVGALTDSLERRLSTTNPASPDPQLVPHPPRLFFRPCSDCYMLSLGKASPLEDTRYSSLESFGTLSVSIPWVKDCLFGIATDRQPWVPPGGMECSNADLLTGGGLSWKESERSL